MPGSRGKTWPLFCWYVAQRGRLRRKRRTSHASRPRALLCACLSHALVCPQAIKKKRKRRKKRKNSEEEKKKKKKNLKVSEERERRKEKKIKKRKKGKRRQNNAAFRGRAVKPLCRRTRKQTHTATRQVPRTRVSLTALRWQAASRSLRLPPHFRAAHFITLDAHRTATKARLLSIALVLYRD